ncbi:ATP-binding cassette domain-containing protein [Candidatus Nomurabacteria bacterium]|uniref:ATP-binding cassette domain-containing protein n=1 Tax=Candidatus Dojkabacteria bacterium TaxID=2099670 RepID=A0A955KY74_9BACT|nr:ATP-binding cassette domain-containing protein [Candidatus Dojkabacteria bacterium]MCB9789529.1 ATP-binding cassette domain-containing protein [Candidatus Nomurabacteria bacterium]
MFELIHTVTLFYGIYLVIEGKLDLGIILLIQWAYSQLWSVVVYIIEYRVALLQQHENATLARETFGTLLQIAEKPNVYSAEWEKLEVRSAKVVFEKGDKGRVTISLPHFEIHKGEKVGLIGESGSGKSTLLYLLAGLMDFDGELVIDNIVTDEDTVIDPSQYTLVDNISNFFNISLRDNLTLGQDIESSEIEKVLKGLTIDTFEKDLEKKYGESAATYSAGQIQRLRIAQGILRNTPIYFFDEPFNGIDDANKRKIMEFIHDFTKDKTMILVTHNQEELEMVDRIYEMKDRVLTERVLD